MSDSPTQANPASLDNDVLTKLQPGMARLMPEIGARFWKAYYAAEAANWPLARWQLKEMVKLFRLGVITRPKYGEDTDEYLTDDIAPLQAAIDAEDFEAFRIHFHEAVDRANEFHRRWKKPYINWKLPTMPPPDLDLTPVATPQEKP